MRVAGCIGRRAMASLPCGLSARPSRIRIAPRGQDDPGSNSIPRAMSPRRPGTGPNPVSAGAGCGPCPPRQDPFGPAATSAGVAAGPCPPRLGPARHGGKLRRRSVPPRTERTTESIERPPSPARVPAAQPLGRSRDRSGGVRFCRAACGPVRSQPRPGSAPARDVPGVTPGPQDDGRNGACAREGTAAARERSRGAPRSLAVEKSRPQSADDIPER